MGATVIDTLMVTLLIGFPMLGAFRVLNPTTADLRKFPRISLGVSNELSSNEEKNLVSTQGVVVSIEPHLSDSDESAESAEAA